MANYTNTLTTNKHIWIEQNIWDTQELATYDVPKYTTHKGEELTFCLACFSDDGDYFYSIQFTKKFDEKDLERWTIIDADLQCLSLKNQKAKRDELIKIIKQYHQSIK